MPIPTIFWLLGRESSLFQDLMREGIEDLTDTRRLWASSSCPTTSAYPLGWPTLRTGAGVPPMRAAC